ncbi:hypothetical protein [Xanthomonas sp. XNM01]|jgi:hypothetical protein|uniref:hypothetical protein n=1 Tax=Xanthomonas sp. XNM01 TaxID=2769289 RepID=UPI001CE0E91B|nr:hypothetical protein [Xanthomonas sp. XNM01]
MDARTEAPARAQMVDLDQEAMHWREAWRTLPRASAMRSFKRYWPVIREGYDVYLRHPHAAPSDNLQRYLLRDAVIASPLTEREAGMVFAQVWMRITS